MCIMVYILIYYCIIIKNGDKICAHFFVASYARFFVLQGAKTPDCAVIFSYIEKIRAGAERVCKKKFLQTAFSGDILGSVKGA